MNLESKERKDCPDTLDQEYFLLIIQFSISKFCIFRVKKAIRALPVPPALKVIAENQVYPVGTDSVVLKGTLVYPEFPDKEE